MQFKRKIKLINGKPFLVLPVRALARLKGKLGDELRFTLTQDGVLLHEVERTPPIHRRLQPKRRSESSQSKH